MRDVSDLVDAGSKLEEAEVMVRFEDGRYLLEAWDVFAKPPGQGNKYWNVASGLALTAALQKGRELSVEMLGDKRKWRFVEIRPTVRST